MDSDHYPIGGRGDLWLVDANIQKSVVVVKNHQNVCRFVKGVGIYAAGGGEPSRPSVRQYLQQLFGTEGCVSDKNNFSRPDSAARCVTLISGRVACDCGGS